MNIYVGNLAADVTEDDLRQVFEAFGQVETVNVMKDRFSGESRGFGFVDMPSRKDGISAIAGANGKNVKGQALKVDEARPRQERRGGGGGGGGGRRY